MQNRGYTMIELMVVLAILATILTLAAPRYFGNIDKAKESVLREDLYLMRDAIDKYFMDKGSYPTQLSDLVTAKYLRAIPVDPMTENAKGWVTEPPTDGSPGQVFNVKSAAPGKARDGSPLKDW